MMVVIMETTRGEMLNYHDKNVYNKGMLASLMVWMKFQKNHIVISFR